MKVMESHGKAIKNKKEKREKKIEKITGKSEAVFTFSRNRHKHAFYALKCWKICQINDCFDTTVRTTA